MKKAQNNTGSDLEKQIQAFQAKCHSVGLKVTPQRIIIYKTLLESKAHPSAEMVFRKVKKLIPTISLDTVNRTLLTLNEIGAAFIVEGSGDSKRFDANFENHQHFKCIKCKRIVDFHHKPFDNIEEPAVLKDKFRILRKTVYFEGICDLCLEKMNDDF